MRACLATLAALLTLVAVSRAQEKALWEVFAADALTELQRRVAATPALRESRDESQQTLLHQAIDRSALRCATWLLAGGAAIDATAYNRFTPLHLAASHGNAEAVKLLLRHHAQLDAKSSFGQTPMQMAAHNHQRATVELLRNAGAEYDLDTAVLLRDLVWVQRCLQDQGAVVPYETVENAVRSGDLAIVRLVYERRGAPPPHTFGFQRLPLACFAIPHAEVLAFLCEHGIDANAPLVCEPAEDAPPLLLAAEQDAAASIEVLLAHGARLDGTTATGRTALLAAAEKGAPAALATLLARGARPAADGPNLATLAARGIYHGAVPAVAARHRQCTELLLAHGVPLELDAAMALGRLPDVERILRERPALATARETQPVLVRASKHARADLLHLLLAAGADVTAADSSGYTALHWAAFLGSVPCLDVLLAQQAPVSAAATNGLTPLHEAVRLDHPEAAERLLRAGADREARDREGERPLDLARAASRERFVKLFAAAPAR